MEKLPLSVIVPVYNAAPYLRRCLDSILGQTRPAESVICIDDGSTDESLAILKEYAAAYESVHVIHKENEGLVRARKTGISMSTQPYTTYVDADDWVEPEMYETMMDAALRHEADIVSSGYFRDFDHRQEIFGNAITPGIYKGVKLRRLKKQVFPTEETDGWRWDLLLWNKVFRTGLLHDCQMDVDERIRFGEDNAVVWPALLQADCVVETGRAFYHYCWRSDSMMEQRTDEREARASFDALSAYLSKKLLPMRERADNIAEQFRIFVAGHLYGLCLWEECEKFYGDVLKPFGDIRKEDRIALYGAGKVGRQLKSYLDGHGYHVVLWVDQKQDGAGVHQPSDLLHADYDIVLVGVQKWSALEGIERNLERLGVPKENIRRLTMERILEGAS